MNAWTQAIPEGEQILTVPLRLSFTDVASKAEGAAANLPWPVRLAARILGEYYEPTSPWKQYLHVRCLPNTHLEVPTCPALLTGIMYARGVI